MYFLVLLLTVLLKESYTTRIQLSTGTIEGKVLNATYSPFGNQSAIVFFGIPYVKPPLGDLRFKKPEPPIPWNGILETKAYRPACMSNALRTYKNKVGGPISEDCLYANVFTNHHCLMSKNCSVMIIIHGGGLLFQSAATFNPQILINNFVGQNRNIVVVTINYRLGVFGFANLAGDTDDKNAGVYDVLAAVKWVRKEIHHFGGNKDRITLGGHSGGGGLAAVLSNSPLSKGLIHQQIIMSGPLYEFFFSKKSNYKGFTKMAQMVGCLSEEYGFEWLPKKVVKKTYSCLRSKPAQNLIDAQLYILQNTTYQFGAPPVDGVLMTYHPDILFSPKAIYPVNTMIGTTTAEYRTTLYLTDQKNADKKEDLLRNVCEHIAYEIYKKPEQFVEKCMKYYIKRNQAQFIADDIEFYSRAASLADSHVSNNTKVFLYSYAYTGAKLAFEKYEKNISPTHSEDLIYSFGTHRAVFAPKDYMIEHIYSGMFANFVNFGDPSPSQKQPWLQYTPEKRDHFFIDFDQNLTMPGMRNYYYEDAIKFWSAAGTKSNSERLAPSLDTFTIKNLVAPIVSHIGNVSTDFYKTFNQTEKLYFEREEFLKELKLERKLALEGKKMAAMKNGEISKTMKGLNTEEGGGGINILLIIFAGTLLGGILYVTISHLCLHYRSREGYELLK